MRSSTSSSNHSSHRAPDHPWGRMWLLAVVVAVCTVGCTEWLWRALGHRPSVIDDVALWSMARDQVSDNNPTTVALLGASRIQLGLSLSAFKEKFPGRKVVQLAVDGAAPFASLRDLTQDKAFRGVVICSLTDRALESYAIGAQQPFVDYYHRYWTVNAWLNRMISTWFQERLIVVHPKVSLQSTLNHLIQSHYLPRPVYLLTQSDRSRNADYEMVDLAKHRKRRINAAKSIAQKYPIPSPDEWLRLACAVNPLVERIQARGGRVVFVHFPVSGQLWEHLQEVLPKDQYWDRFAASSRAAAIHFRDVPTLGGFDCPDYSHLDGRDAPKFTAALCDELIRRGVLVP